MPRCALFSETYQAIVEAKFDGHIYNNFDRDRRKIKHMVHMVDISSHTQTNLYDVLPLQRMGLLALVQQCITSSISGFCVVVVVFKWSSCASQEQLLLTYRKVLSCWLICRQSNGVFRSIPQSGTIGLEMEVY